MRITTPLCILILIISSVASVQAAIVVPGADGSDGVLNPTSNMEIDLTQAASSPSIDWDTPSPIAGKGVYDGEKWAVVFKYSEVNIPAGVTVTFKNHVPNAPVVWLVSGSVTINGSVILDGKGWLSAGQLAEGGPGGFRSGTGPVGTNAGASGFGPGGGIAPTESGAYATSGYAGVPTYGAETLIPLIGGSGSAEGDCWGPVSGGGGGGAILVAAADTITVNGSISANGGYSACQNAYGSGGGIRLVADTYNISGTVSARGKGAVGDGRIRVEALHGSGTGTISPALSFGVPADPAQLWPEAGAPDIKVTHVAAVAVAADPTAGLDFPNQDVSISTDQPAIVRLEASHVPLDWNVKVRVAPRNGQAAWINATRISGDANTSVWEATVTLPKGFTAIQARASKP